MAGTAAISTEPVHHRHEPAVMRGAVLAVIPAFNEAQRIAPVIVGLRAQGLPVLVVDDGSRDHTGAVAQRHGAAVLAQANSGKGAAILAGCAWACARGYHKVLLLDGDGQHDPREAARLIEAGHGADLVIGKRLLRCERQPSFRRALNRLSSLLITGLAGRRIRDSQSGFRLCRSDLLLRLPLAGCHFDLESEMCILTARAGLRVREVPITVIYNDKVSGVHPLWDTLRFLRACVVAWTRARRHLRAAQPRSHREAQRAPRVASRASA